MPSKLPIPKVPLPPRGEITPEFMNRMVRELQDALDKIIYPGPMRGTVLTLTAVPGSPGGLNEGDVFHDDGVLHIILPNRGYAGSLSGEGAVGTVTVVTT